MAKRFITPKELLKAADVTELQRDDYFIFFRKTNRPKLPCGRKNLIDFLNDYPDD
jgi:hypothetical protein